MNWNAKIDIFSVRTNGHVENLSIKLKSRFGKKDEKAMFILLDG